MPPPTYLIGHECNTSPFRDQYRGPLPSLARSNDVAFTNCKCYNHGHVEGVPTETNSVDIDSHFNAMSHSTTNWRQQHQIGGQWILLSEAEPPIADHSAMTEAAMRLTSNSDADTLRHRVKHAHQSSYHLLPKPANSDSKGEAQGLLDRNEAKDCTIHSTIPDTPSGSGHYSSSTNHEMPKEPSIYSAGAEEGLLEPATWIPYTLRIPFLAGIGFSHLPFPSRLLHCTGTQLTIMDWAKTMDRLVSY